MEINIQDIVYKEISAYKQCQIEDLSSDTSLLDLGIDSLGAITILYNLEDKLDIEIPNEMLGSLSTIGDIQINLENLIHQNGII